MCTSFVKESYIAMNFDHHESNYKMSTKKDGWLLVYVKTDHGMKPSFGIHRSGAFFNQLMVEPCENGKYRRKKGVIHLERLVSDLIDGKLSYDDLDKFLTNHEMVNVPNRSVHSMLCGKKGNVWIVEPGRGQIHRQLKSNEFQVMTNFSLMDSISSPCWRYQMASDLLSENDHMDVKKAFRILQAVKQNEKDWITRFSMVYDPIQKTVYYCENQDFTNIKAFLFY